jgi:hypothetical protein
LPLPFYLFLWKEKKMTDLALASETKKVQPPKGYLSFKELSEKYPDFYADWMTGPNRDRPLRIWVDSDKPIYLTLTEKVIPELTDDERKERRAMLAKVPFRMEEDRYVEVITKLDGRTDKEITVNDFVYNWGDPNFRLDLDKKPVTGVDYVKGMSESRWRSLKTSALDRFRRNPAMMENERYIENRHETIPAKYRVGTFDPENTHPSGNPELSLWGKIPPVYVLPPDSYGYVLKDEKSTEDQVIAALTECELSTTKAVYSDDELDNLKPLLVKDNLIKDTADLTQIRRLIKFAQTTPDEPEAETEVN